MLVHPDHLVIPVRKVHLDHKAKPDPLVKMVKTEQTALTDNLARLVNLVPKELVDSPVHLVFPVQRDIVVFLDDLEKTANPDVMEKLVLKVLWVIPVPLVLLDHPVNKVPEDTLVNLVMPVHEDPMVCLVNLAHPDQWVQLAHPDFLEALDQRVNPVLLVTKVPKDHKVHVVRMVEQDLLVIQDSQVFPVWMELMELKVQLVMLVHLVLLVSQVLAVLPAHKVTWGHPVLRVTKVFPVLLV